MNTTPTLVALVGGTASGKTSLARVLHQQLGDGAVVLSHDRYYRSADPRTTNFDHPDALDNEVMATDLASLRRGEAVLVPHYDFTTHQRRPREEWATISARPLVLVEGILLLAIPTLRAQFDLSIYIDAPADIRLMRRIRRDVVERGRTLTDVLHQYETQVRPMHEQFVEPSRILADLTLDGTRSIDRLAAELMPTLRRSS